MSQRFIPNLYINFNNPNGITLADYTFDLENNEPENKGNGDWDDDEDDFNEDDFDEDGFDEDGFDEDSFDEDDYNEDDYNEDDYNEDDYNEDEDEDEDDDDGRDKDLDNEVDRDDTLPAWVRILAVAREAMEKLHEEHQLCNSSRIEPPRPVRKEREGPCDGISNHETRTLKDGTIVKGKQGVTFAGFIPPRAQKQEPELRPAGEIIELPTPESLPPEPASETPLTMAPEHPALMTPSKDCGVQSPDSTSVKRKYSDSSSDDIPLLKKSKLIEELGDRNIIAD
ncbi:hypothetical protein F5Y12DRAFT_791172 [Xylaria sp. FL1777]|nr:hypothetical protein F5Y12DRAFT_791172 [Xylaria sp. FL1777]